MKYYFNYYVASDDGSPQRIYFELSDAFESRYEFVDVFDQAGFYVESWKLVNGKYTQDF